MSQKKLKKSYREFEETFRELRVKTKKEQISLLTLLNALGGRGRILLLIFLSLGFGQIPVISLFWGLFIAYLGLQIAIDRSRIWVPKSLLSKKIPSYFLITVINQILCRLKFLKKGTHPRYEWATQQTSTRILNGLMISLVGLSFAISPPIPLVGLVAFIAIFSIAIGLLNEDGIYIIGGYVCSVIYFILTFLLLKFTSLGQMREWVKQGVAYFFPH